MIEASVVGPQPTARKPLSVRTRFEIFKRDDFRCAYCGRRSPDVVLEVDHIIPVASGGSSDPVNLITSCWACNSGKAAVPLDVVITAEDPHERAIDLLERERQLAEYNAVLARQTQRRDEESWDLVFYWLGEQGKLTPAQEAGDETVSFNRRELAWLKNALVWCPREKIREFMDYAIAKDMTKSLRYVMACARNWRYEHTALTDQQRASEDC